MMDHEKHSYLQVLDVFEDDINEREELVVVEQELELPLDNGYALFEEVHNCTTLEQIYEGIFRLLREVHDPTPMDSSHDETFTLSNHLGQFVHSPTSYPSISCGIHRNENLVQGFLLLVAYEEYETPTLHDDTMMRSLHYILKHKYPLITFDDFLIHGCTYDVHLSHLKTHDFACSLLSSCDVKITSSNAWVKKYMIGENFYWKKHPFLFLDDTHIQGCIYDTHSSSFSLCNPLDGIIYSSNVWVKEHTTTLYDTSHTFLEQHFWKWDPHLCHWSRSNWLLGSFVHL